MLVTAANATQARERGDHEDMERLLMRYRVKPDRLEEHLRLLAEVFEELNRVCPEGLSWATFRLEDGSFLEIAIDPDLPGPLPGLASFARYRADLDDRCSHREATEIHQIGAYRFPQPVRTPL
jgi:hypothetical protein